ncbi:hypothetical protein F2Q68_00038835 [Brassica cretica]|uniref:Reverse transcriptase zinc-binding domain-containing protein n=2 Tax=Brassica cretica TaxID=69181 RepID=A0ABQ7A5Q9_BRACR|nr:hypothetical protein F2Q68_00038835 [Brassica cretica]KAF3492999.1 hypothetical protein DY000_02052398 [Brassica cretica]
MMRNRLGWSGVDRIAPCYIPRDLVELSFVAWLHSRRSLGRYTASVATESLFQFSLSEIEAVSSHGDLVVLQALGLTFSVYVLMSSVHPLFTSFDLCICVVFPFVKGFSFWENSVFAGNGLRGTSVPLAPSML